MRVFITGGTGFIGSNLAKALCDAGHEVTVLGRSARSARPLPEGVQQLVGDSTRPGSWQEELAKHEVVINLAGASIFQRWTPGAKQAIRDSRILTTRNVVDAMAARGGAEAHLLSADAVGYYGFRGDEIIDERHPPGTDFLSKVAVEWESEALRAQELGARVVITRFGIVMGREGGVLGQLVPLFRRYLGSPLGSGRQWFSWIHERDLARTFVFLLDRPGIDGPVNCMAPEPLTNREFTAALAEVLGRPVILPAVPRFVLRLILGEFADVIVEGQRAVPRKLLDGGFRFEFPAMREALQDLLGEPRPNGGD